MKTRSALLPGLLIAAVLTTSACDKRRDSGRVVVSAIGGDLAIGDPSRATQSYAARVMMDATAQGLVRFDADGQIEPGIAERWIVIDDGMSYIFRLRDAEWGNGDPVTASEVVAVLRRQIASRSRNPLAPFLSAIDEIVEMTPEVIEVRLKRPRPDLLKLFAQPELAVSRTRPVGGSGPMRVVSMTRGTALLRPARDPSRSPDDVADPTPEDDVRLIGERAARAIARFAEGDSDLVTGGTFADWPLITTASIPPINRKVDPAAGLFGLLVVNRDGFLADVRARTAISGALDRQSIVAAFLPEWTVTTQVLPEQLDSAAAPVTPGWTATAQDDRLRAATALVDTWRATHPGPLTLRVALPDGPGATLLYGMIGASFGAMGIQLQRVGLEDEADLRLIDSVAPYDSARWYLATACAPCGEDATAAITASRDAPDMATRAQHLAEADIALDADAAYIPIARPLRWSLVASRLRQWEPNARAWHPLNHLRAIPN